MPEATPPLTAEKAVKIGMKLAKNGSFHTIPYDKFLDEQDAQNIELKIAQSDSIDQLKLVLEGVPGIQGSQKYYSKKELFELISTSQTAHLPRTFGLRDKVISLLETTDKPEEARPINAAEPPMRVEKPDIKPALRAKSHDSVFAFVNPLRRKIGRILGLSPVLAIQDELVLKLLGYAKPKAGEKRQANEDHYNSLFDKLSNEPQFSDVERLIKEKSAGVASPGFKKTEPIAAQNLITEARVRWLQHHMINRKRG